MQAFHVGVFVSLLASISALAGCAEPPTPDPNPSPTALPAAVSPSPTAPPAAVPALSQSPRLSVVYSLAGSGDVRVSNDLAYAPEKSAHHLLDIYRPQTNDALPAVVLIHGAAPARGQLKNSAPFTSWGRLVAASGFAAITLNWDNPDAGDLAKALAYLRAQAQPLGLDMGRTCFVMFSAGVEPALSWALASPPEGLRCLVAYYGDHGRAAEALAASATGGAVPVLVARAGRDEIIRDDHLQPFLAAAAQRGVSVQVETHPDGVHAFDLRNDDATSRAIIEATLSFLRANLGSS